MKIFVLGGAGYTVLAIVYRLIESGNEPYRQLKQVILSVPKQNFSKGDLRNRV